MSVYAIESRLVHAVHARDDEKVQKALADGETTLRKIKPPEWARSDHVLLTKEWVQLESDAADARDDPGAGFEEAVRADSRQISATTARLAAAAAEHRARASAWVISRHGDTDAAEEECGRASDGLRRRRVTVQRMDNVGIVVESLDAAISFFTELGLELEGRATIEGEWAGRVTGLGDQRVEIAMMRTPDGHNRLELSRFLTPPPVADHRKAPVNSLGYLRVMFAVDDIDETLDRLLKHGAQLLSSEVVQYEDSYRLCYIRGPEGLLIGLAEQIG